MELPKMVNFTASMPQAMATYFAELYAKLISQDRYDFYNVPEELRVEVAAILIRDGFIDKVPEEYRPQE